MYQVILRLVGDIASGRAEDPRFFSKKFTKWIFLKKE